MKGKTGVKTHQTLSCRFGVCWGQRWGQESLRSGRLQRLLHSLSGV